MAGTKTITELTQLTTVATDDILPVVDVSDTTDDPAGTTKHVEVSDLISSIGAGDVVGPASSTNENISVFDGVTGKKIKDGGKTIAQTLDRTNHTGTQTASTISDFDTEVSNNTDVTANTAKRHDAATVTDTNTIDMTIAGQDIKGDLKFQDSTTVDLSSDIGGLKADVIESGLSLNNLGEKSYSSLTDKPTIPANLGDLGGTLDDISDGLTYVKSENNFTDADHTNLDANTVHRTSDGSDHTYIDQDVTSGSSPTFVGTNFTGIPATSVEIDEIGTSTYDDVQDWMNINQSAGLISGGLVSSGTASGTVDIASGTGFIRSVDSEIGDLKSFDFVGTNGLPLLSGSNNWIYIAYNGGTPSYNTTANVDDIDFNTEILIAQAYRKNGDLDIISAGPRAYNVGYRTARRAFDLRRVERASGLVISETGTRNLAMSAGKAYYGTTPQDYSALDTSVSDTFSYWYRDGIGGWTEVLSQTQINNTQYDDGTGTLATLQAQQYGVHWVFLSFDGTLQVVYGQDSYTLAEAEGSTVPSSLPDFLNTFGFIIGRIIIARDGVIFTDISTAFEVTFATSTAGVHNDLAGLQGGTTDQYYHATSAEYTVLQNTSGTNTGDQVSSDFTHNDLTGLNDGDYKHLTATNHTDLTDGDDSSLHFHSSDRNRTNHTGTQTASTISDFDTEVSNNSDVTANTTHRGLTNNPHVVTATQVGKDVAQWNADEIQGVTVDDTDIGSGKVLAYNSTSGNLEYETVGGVGTVTSVSAGNGMDFTEITSAGDVTMGTPSSITSSSTNSTTPSSHTHELATNAVTIDKIESTDRSGLDGTLITGTKGVSGDFAKWDSNGDLIDGPVVPNGSVVGTTDTQTLTNKTLGATTMGGDLNMATYSLTNSYIPSPVITTPQINDTSEDNRYIFNPSELTTDRTVTLPLLTSNDEFVFKDHTQTLTNKTIDGDNNTVQDLDGSALTKFDGWIPSGETWTYASADDPTYTFTISGDKTSKYSAGMKIKLTQTTAKYFIITKVAYSSPNTTITIYGGTDYDLANAAITSPYYSMMRTPQGFPMNPTKWTEEVKSVNYDSQSSPTINTWYNVGTNTIDIPIGVWNVNYVGNLYAVKSNANIARAQATLSTSSNTESDVDFTSFGVIQCPAGSGINTGMSECVNKDKVLELSTKDTYYLNIRCISAADTIRWDGGDSTTIIRAVCAYL